MADQCTKKMSCTAMRVCINMCVSVCVCVCVREYGHTCIFHCLLFIPFKSVDMCIPLRKFVFGYHNYVALIVRQMSIQGFI